MLRSNSRMQMRSSGRTRKKIPQPTVRRRFTMSSKQPQVQQLTQRRVQPQQQVVAMPLSAPVVLPTAALAPTSVSTATSVALDIATKKAEDAVAAALEAKMQLANIQASYDTSLRLYRNEILDLQSSITEIKSYVQTLQLDNIRAPVLYNIGSTEISISSLGNLSTNCDYLSFTKNIHLYGSYTSASLKITDTTGIITFPSIPVTITNLKANGSINILNNDAKNIYAGIIKNTGNVINVYFSNRPLLPINIGFNGTVNIDVKIQY